MTQEMYEMVCKGEFADIKGDLKEVLKTLKGNGDVGLCEKVRKQAERIDAIELEHQEIRKAVKNTVKWVASIVIGWWLLTHSPQIFEWLKKIL